MIITSPAPETMQQDTAGEAMADSPQNHTGPEESPAESEQQLEVDLINHVSSDQRVFYKSQQINDPELTPAEKLTILKDVLNKSHTTFLARFGLFINPEHLRFFEQDEQTSGYSPDERYEVGYYLDKIRRTHANGKQEARNRRYAALKQLVQEGQYFSETEMMQREPLLYEQLVGQYMTEKEKRARDAAVQKNDSLVTILFNGMDKENADLLRQEQEKEEKGMDEEETEDYSGRESPAFSRSQWGNFDEEEEERQKKVQRERDSKRRNDRISIPVGTLTAGERSLLRDEFVGTMYSRFVAGEDSEFDYSKIDESAEFQNLDILEQDEQERYFDTDEDATDCVTSKMEENDDEEDDLDVYMKHLNQHLENQNKLDQMSHQMRDVNCEYDSDE